jgi:hypothetical protein
MLKRCSEPTNAIGMAKLVITPPPAPSERRLKRAVRIQKELMALRAQLALLLEEPCQPK